ncbi:MAG TPA: endonuclease V [Methanothermobacter sp.]|nr:endonuclease V [Methanothermobacter sp.]HOL68963.1 endonuclease V [Methanothermobacter sp.]
MQCEWSKKVVKKDVISHFKYICGADISFTVANKGIAAAVIMNTHLEVVEKAYKKVELPIPYISGFLGFREAEAILDVLNGLENPFDVLMVNGNGTLHPRGFGLASHVGVLLGKPTIGITRRPIKEAERDNSLLKIKGKVEGKIVNGIIVSVGHKITLKTAVKVVKNTSIYKMPEPLRQAHILCTKKAKEELK